jgi:hypothetical protein
MMPTNSSYPKVEMVVILPMIVMIKFFPREITHATDTQKITCGCEVCIISGSMIKDLHVWEREH